MTKRHVLEGTSKWSAKVAIKGSILRREPVTFRESVTRNGKIDQFNESDCKKIDFEQPKILILNDQGE